LRPSDVEALIVELRGKKLADSTVRQVYTVLRQPLDVAVRDLQKSSHRVSLRPSVSHASVTSL
jgi:integrase